MSCYGAYMSLFKNLFKYINSKSDFVFVFAYVLPVFVLFALLIYFDSFFYGVSNYDDHVYFSYLNNIFKDGVTLIAFKSVFTDFVNANWHPVTIFSLAIDYLISNNNPVYFHVVNVVIHVVNALLVYTLFYKLSANKFASMIAALLFIIHPLNVETVVWISERKGLLATLFALASIIFYIKYKNETISVYKIISVFFLALSLLSKPTTAPTPIVLMLLDLTLLRNGLHINSKILWSSFKNKLPYFAVVLGVVIFSFMAQSESGALRDIATVSISSRIEASINNIFIYISKIFLPLNLASYYPHVEKSLTTILSYLVFLFSWVFLGFRYFSKSKMYAFCVLFFFIQLAPMSGIFQTGSHSIANRYTYLPSISLFFIFAMMVTKFKNLSLKIGVVFLVVFLFVAISINQARVWKSDLSMWENNAKNADRNYDSAYYYSKLLVESGKVDEGLSFFYNTIGIKNTFHANITISNMAALFIDHNLYIEAKMILVKGINNNFHGEGIHRQIALLEYFYFNMKKSGLEQILIALNLYPNSFYVNRIYAKILFDQKKYNKALKILTKMKEIQPTKNDDGEQFKLLIKQDIELVLKEMH